MAHENDRLAFGYARQASEIVHNARSRAAGRGAAQLVIYENVSGARGTIMVYEAIDGLTLASTPVGGPNPVASCRNASQWARAIGATEVADFKSQLVEGMNLNSVAGGINETDDIRMAGRVEQAGSPGTWDIVNSWALCTTPNGTTYFGSGATPTVAVGLVQTAAPFTGMAELEITRNKGGTPAGLKRRVIIAGSAAPRIQSE